MTKGHNWEQRAKNARRFGKVPDHLIRPTLRGDCAWAYRAFWDLHTCRSYTAGGFGPISFLSVMEYASIKGYGQSASQELWELIHPLDMVMIEEQGKKAVKSG